MQLENGCGRGNAGERLVELKKVRQALEVGGLKVAIPTDDGVSVSRHFGRAKYLLLADAGSTWRKLVLLEQWGHRLAANLKKEGVEKVVCRSLGAGMQRWLRDCGIMVAFTDEAKIDRVIQKIRQSE